MARKLNARIFILITVLLALTCTALRTVAMYTSFDTDIGYFKGGALSTASDIISLVSIIAIIVLAMLTPKSTVTVSDLNRINTPFAYMQLGNAALLIVGSIIFLILYMQSKSVLDLLLVISGIPAAVYFVTSYLYKKEIIKISATTVAGLGMLVILWALLCIAHVYFDNFVQMNSPIKNSIQFGFLSIMISMLADIRYLIGKPSPRFYLCSHGLTFFLCLVGTVPYLIYDFRISFIDESYCRLVFMMFGWCILAAAPSLGAFASACKEQQAADNESISSDPNDSNDSNDPNDSAESTDASI